MALDVDEVINETADRNRRLGSTVGTPIPEASESMRGRGRGGRRELGLNNGDGASSDKRKRAKTASVTPSINDGGEERGSVCLPRGPIVSMLNDTTETS